MHRAVLRWTILLAAATTAALTSAAPAAADVATYTQYACHLPDGTPAPTDGFTLTAGGLGWGADHCATGGGLDMYLPTTDSPQEAWAKWTYAAPVSTTVDRIEYLRTASNIGSTNDESTRVYAGATDNAHSTDRCGWYGPCSPGPTALSIAGPVSPISFHSYCEYQACHGPASGDGFASVDRIAITLRDDSSPAFSARPTGDMLDSGPVSGTRYINYHVNDAGGGVYEAALVVDGSEMPRQVVDANGGACQKPFVRAAPCSSDVAGTVSIDTTHLADGTHDVSLNVYDVTELNKATFGPFPIDVQNRTPTPSPSSTTAPTSSSPSDQTTAGSDHDAAAGSLRIRLGKRFVSGRVVQHYGRRTYLHGTIVGVNGPVAGATVHLFSVATARDEAITTTRSNGRFILAIPSGVSRRLMLHATTTAAGLSVDRPVRVIVRVPLRLAANRRHLLNHQVLVLHAIVARAPFPHHSARVQFQVQIDTQWRTFATRMLGAAGDAKTAHRFRVTFQRIAYRFRAVLVGTKDYPFAPSTSASLKVQVN